MKFLTHLIGTEGSGHHMFESCSSIRQIDNFHHLWLKYMNIESPDYLSPALEEDIIEYWNCLPEFTLHMERSSYPYYRPLNSLRRYDLTLFDKIAVRLRNTHTFYIIIYRDIIRSTFSAFKRFDKRKNHLLHVAQVQEDNLLYIQSFLNTIDNSKFLILDYDDILMNKEKLQPILRKYTKQSNFDIDVDKIKSPNQILNSEEEKLNILKNYFCETRLSKFNYLFSKITTLV